jgi:very-short-patch-repair endonuclease
LIPALKAVTLAVDDDLTPAEKAAITRSKRLQKNPIIGKEERRLTYALRRWGLPIVQQQPVGPYNVDLACWPVAIEVQGKGWKWPHEQPRLRRRTIFLIERGWRVLYLQLRFPHGCRPQTGARTIQNLAMNVWDLSQFEPNPDYRVMTGIEYWRFDGWLRADELVIYDVPPLDRALRCDPDDTDPWVIQ